MGAPGGWAPGLDLASTGDRGRGDGHGGCWLGAMVLAFRDGLSLPRSRIPKPVLEQSLKEAHWGCAHKALEEFHLRIFWVLATEKG